MEGEGMMREESSRKQNATVKIVGIVSLAVVLLAAVLSDTIYEKASNTNRVSVIGRGTVKYHPDLATITLGVRIDSVPTAEAALQQLNEKASKIVTAIKGLDIPQDKIQTEQYVLFPQYAYSNTGTSSVSGYGASQQIVIKIENIDKDNEMLVSKVLEEASHAGANDIRGVSFTVANAEKLKERAREEALSDARKKSQDIARAAGVRLGKVVGWYETIISSPDGSGNPPVPATTMGFGGGASDEKVRVTPEVPSGDGEVIIDMSVDFEVR